MNSLVDTSFIKIDNADCFSGDNMHITMYENLETCIDICKNLNINVFVIYNNYVYYKRQPIKECVFNMISNSNITMYILLDKDYSILNSSDRISIYAKGIIDTKFKTNLNHNKYSIIEYINKVCDNLFLKSSVRDTKEY
jgi:DNA-binding XRE family transcriptional regulator